MESLNLNNLANSLPSSRYANAEKELTDNFRGMHHRPISTPTVHTTTTASTEPSDSMSNSTTSLELCLHVDHESLSVES